MTTKKTVGLKFDILVANYSKRLEMIFFYPLNTFWEVTKLYVLGGKNGVFLKMLWYVIA
jgi:hypothetical protein